MEGPSCKQMKASGASKRVAHALERGAEQMKLSPGRNLTLRQRLMETQAGGGEAGG